MDGSEYVDADWIAARWTDLNRAFAEEIHAHRGPVAEWLRARHPSWHVVGKVCLHLAENRGDDAHPFAFLATYAVCARAPAARCSTVRSHAPRGIPLHAATGRPPLHLLVPLQRAADQIAWFRS
jgi:non-specific serine/threonine protein kinase